MSLESKITGLKKQNDGIYSSLISKNINYDRISILEEELSQEDILEILENENIKLKELAIKSKPPPKIKEIKIKAPEEQPIIKKKDIIIDENNDEIDDNYEDKVKKFDIITNMEDIKRSFMNNDESFKELILAHKFNYYRAKYNFNSYMDKSPEYVARNLLTGFVQNFDSYRKYFMICFRVKKQDMDDSNINKYLYEALFIINSNDLLVNFVGSFVDDFQFEIESDVESFLTDFKKLPESTDNLIGEVYVH